MARDVSQLDLSLITSREMQIEDNFRYSSRLKPFTAGILGAWVAADSGAPVVRVDTSGAFPWEGPCGHAEENRCHPWVGSQGLVAARTKFFQT